MKKLSGILGILLASSMASFAIEGLQISVQSTNVILSWPSATNETYLVQYRPTLNVTDSWQTLTDDFPAAVDTNITFFVQSNSVNYPDLMLGGGGSGSEAASEEAAIMAMPANGSGDAVPLMLYPPGFDLSKLIIFDPTTGEWVSGKGYTISPPSGDDVQAGGAQPDDGSGDTNSYTGFYRVVRDGAHLYGLTNGMVVSNELITPIEFAVDSTDQIVGVTFYDENTNPIVGVTAQPFGNNAWLLVWNTTLSLNGDYTIYAELNFASDNSVVGQPVTVTVDNTISFPNYSAQVFGDQMWIYAQTIPDAAYEIDIYDENTNYVGSFYGSADDNGVISFFWNLVDGNGIMHDDTNFLGVFTVDTSSLSGGSPAQLIKTTVNPSASNFQTSSLTHKILVNRIGANGPSPADGSPNVNAQYFWSREPAWSYNGPWVIAYGQFATNGSPLISADQNMLTGGVGSPLQLHGIITILDPNGTGLNVSPGNNSDGVFTVNSAASAGQLLGYLNSSLFGNTYRNFFYFGHGNNHEIGDKSKPYPSGGDLTLDQIAFALGNVPLSYTVPAIGIDRGGYPVMTTVTFDTTIQHAALHPYRFVYLDGCDTGAGNMSEAFGIPAQTLSTNNFAAQGVESRVFIGYKSWKVDNITQLNWENYSSMIWYFMYAWTTAGFNAGQCVGQAQANVWLSPPMPSTRADASMDSSAVIYGAADMNAFTHTGQ